MAERESRNWFVSGKIRESEMCVSDCIQKVNVSGQAFCSWCHETIRYGPINQHFVSSLDLLHIILIFANFVAETRILAEMKIENRGKKYFPLEKKSISILFFPMKIKMIDLWMQIEGRKLIFIMNFSVLDFFEFASRMPQTAQILVSTFKIFPGEGGGGACPRTP